MNSLPNASPFSIQALRERICDKLPQETAKFDNALKYVIPQLLPDESLDAPLEDERLAEFAARIPAVDLLDCFNGKRWDLPLVQKDERFRTLPALSEEGRMSTIRCLKHAQQSLLMPRWPKGLTPGGNELHQRRECPTASYQHVQHKRQSAEVTQWQRRQKLMDADFTLWHTLVFEALPRLRKATNALKDRMQSENNPALQKYWATRWAGTLRNEILFGLLLTLQFRARHLCHAKLGVDYFPETYEFTIPGAYDKHGSPHRIQLPSNGPLSKLKGLMDLYLSEARDILLNGRPESPYVFLVAEPRRGVACSFEDLSLSDSQLARAFDSICRTSLEDLLPAGLDFLHPHDFRTIWANYAFGVGNGRTHIREGIGDIPAAAHQHHGNQAQSDRDVIARPGNLSAGNTRNKRVRRKQARLAIKEALGENGDPTLLRQIMRIIN